LHFERLLVVDVIAVLFRELRRSQRLRLINVVL
jgi:hypothetical protein